MFKTALLTITSLFLISLSAFAAETDYVVGKARTLDPDRFDRLADGSDWSKMDKTIYTNCVLWQTFSYDDGTNYYDLGTLINDAVAANANTALAWSNASGGIVRSDGVDDRAFMTGSKMPDAPFTLSFWMWHYGDNTSVDCGISFILADTTSFGEYVFIRLGQFSAVWVDEWISIVTRNSSAQTGVYAFRSASNHANTWHHVAITGDGSTYLMYVDGVRKTLATDTGAYPGTAANNGKFADLCDPSCGHATLSHSVSFNGLLDDYRLDNRVLTSNEVFTTLYTATASKYP